MSKRILFQISILLLSIITMSMECRTKVDGYGNYLLPESKYTINGAVFTGQGFNDKSLSAVTVPCANNNTIRMYYSSSVNFKVDTLLTIVATSSASALKHNECYFEVTTSATDTWLSTGVGNIKVKVTKPYDLAGPPDIDPIRHMYEFIFPDLPLQHFTSIPLNDYGHVFGNIVTLEF